MADRPITAVIVEDHVVVVAGVQHWCAKADPPIRLVSAGAQLGHVWTGPGAEADVVIFDLQLQGDRQEFAELRRLVDRGRRVVVYSQDAHNTTAVRCVELGALAYVTKREGEEHLVAAVRAAADGMAYTPPSLSGALVADDDPTRPRLAPMEVAALRAWFASSSKQLAAAMLNISAKTVDTYIERVRIKYAGAGRSAPTKSDLVARALEDGLICLSDLTEKPTHLRGDRG
jgi:DNA-binding NarL/FixJ family response regulator